MSTLGNKTTGGFSTISKQSLTGDGGTSYTLTQSVNNENELEVYVNNTRQEPTTAYTAQGTTLTMTGAVNASDSFYVIFQGKAVVSQEGIFGNSSTRFTSDNVTIGGTLAVTGDVSVDTDTLKVDATNDKVGINTASPSDYYSDELVVTAADEGGMTIVTGTTHANYINFADGTSGNAAYRGFLKYDHNNDNMTLGTSAAAAMVIDANGVITDQNPSFLAKISGSYPDMAIATVPFNHAVHNTGSHYNTSNYKFTAPVAGRYYLSYSVRVNHTTSGHIIHPCFQINGTNDTASLTIHKNDTTGQYMHTSFSYVRNLSASDYVTVTMANGTNGGGTMQDNQCSFSGHLLG